MPEDKFKIEVSPHRQMRIDRIELSEEEAEKFIELISRAYRSEKPAKEDLKAIRRYLIDNPQLCKMVFSVVDATQSLLIKHTMGEHAVTEIAVEEYITGVRDEMGYHHAPIMERLLIENIITAWLHVQFCHSQLMFRSEQGRIPVIEFWERRLTMAQRRYLSACETLAKIRKMAIPALQLNIGDKQVNVAGNLEAR